jgi:tRNA threonylcarbamoyladenosine biosynthesis protein TsaB
VAVGCGDTLLAAEELAMAHGQAEALLPMVDRLMGTARVKPDALDFVAATVGPGSFTGIRVGLAAGRGIALAVGVPLIGVTVFAATAAAVALEGRANNDLLLIALDSRRADLFVQLFDPAFRPRGAPATVLPEALDDFVGPVAGNGAVLIAGDAAQRAAAALAMRRTRMRIADAAPRVAGALIAALARWRQGERDDRACPLYLRTPAVTFATRSLRRDGV